MSVAHLEVDREGIVRLWDDGARALFGYGPDEAVGRSVELIIPQNFRARHWAGFRRFVATGVSHLPEIAESTGITKSGELVRLAISVEALRNGKGTIVGVAATMRKVE